MDLEGEELQRLQASFQNEALLPWIERCLPDVNVNDLGSCLTRPLILMIAKLLVYTYAPAHPQQLDQAKYTILEYIEREFDDAITFWQAQRIKAE